LGCWACYKARIGVKIAVGTDLVVDDRFVVFAYAIDTEVLVGR
jgi:hypothetical protein